MTPTARSLIHLRATGALAAFVEKWNPHAKIRQDFLGFGDILAVEPARVGVTAVQACITKDMQKRLRKILSDPVRQRVGVWLAANNRLYIWGWAKRGKRGQPKLWKMTQIDVGDEYAVQTTRDVEVQV